MPFELTIAEGRGRGRRFRFATVEVTIGRAPENDLLLIDAGVSRSHARIRAEGPGHVLVDDRSRNGTALNGLPIHGTAALSPGDRIGIGPLVFEYAPGLRTGVPGAWILRATNGVRAALRRALRMRGGPPPGWRRIGTVSCAASCLLLAAVASFHGRGPGPTLQGPAVARTGIPPPTVESVQAVPDSGRTLAASHAGEAREWYERGRRKLEERRVAPRNLYDAWSSFTAARRLLGADPLPPPLDALPGLTEAAERDLARDCKDLLFAARRFARYGQEQRAQAAYREVLLHFPGDDPSGCREKARQELAADAGGEGDAG
jgi:FHA domain-containing protein